jgi:hypothetical protein
VRFKHRSRYFELRAGVWFRLSRDAEWRMGFSRCVSTTGAVIESDDLPSVSDVIVVVIALPGSGCLVGRGRVVRAQRSTDPDRPATFVIAVSHYALEHRARILTGTQPVLHGC